MQVCCDDLTKVFSKWHDERLFGWHPLRFTVIPADQIPADEQTADELYLDSLRSNGPGDVVVTDPIRYQVATVLPKVLEKLQAAQPAPESAASESAGAATAAQKAKELATGQKPDSGQHLPSMTRRSLRELVEKQAKTGKGKTVKGPSDDTLNRWAKEANVPIPGRNEAFSSVQIDKMFQTVAYKPRNNSKYADILRAILKVHPRK